MKDKGEINHRRAIAQIWKKRLHRLNHKNPIKNPDLITNDLLTKQTKSQGRASNVTKIRPPAVAGSDEMKILLLNCQIVTLLKPRSKPIFGYITATFKRLTSNIAEVLKFQYRKATKKLITRAYISMVDRYLQSKRRVSDPT
jgi:hypothetical protein